MYSMMTTWTSGRPHDRILSHRQFRSLPEFVNDCAIAGQDIKVVADAPMWETDTRTASVDLAEPRSLCGLLVSRSRGGYYYVAAQALTR